MRSEIKTIRLTNVVKNGTMEIPAAPRNSSAYSSAPSCALLRSMIFRASSLVLAAGLIAGAAFAATTTTSKSHKKKKSAVVTAPRAVTATAKPLVAVSAKSRQKTWVQTWDEPTYKDSTVNDKVDGEDLNVRKAAVDALGPLNGSVVVTDPTTGRVLTIVNQPLALGGGFQPCSTVKVSVALARSE